MWLLYFYLLVIPTWLYNSTEIPEPYKSTILLTPKYFDGWFFPVNKKMLDYFIKNQKPLVVAEIGSWLGASTIFMAELLSDNAKIYAIDHWQGSIEHKTDNNFTDMLPSLYQQFLSNVIHRKQTSKIIPIRMSSMQAAQELNITPDLVYIDGSHDEKDVYEDIMAWYKKLQPQGILCGDDYGWGNSKLGYVKNGVDKAARDLGVNLTVLEDRFWYFSPKK
jgi:predicted O-methyltransferase YrrM